ncbi:STAS domain-containing protein [Thiolapillus sp.]
MTGSSNTALHLEPHLEFDGLPVLAQKIRESLAEDSPLILDGSGIQSIDGAAIQLLLLAIRTAKEKNIPCSWHQPSPALSKTVALLGLTDEMLLEVKAQ